MTNILHNLHPTTLIYLLILVAYVATVISCCIVVMSENRNPIKSLSWVIALIFLPGIGLVFYLFFGRSLKSMRLISRSNKRRLYNRRGAPHVDIDKLPIDDNARQLIRLSHSLSETPLTVNNRIEIFTKGEEKFEALKKDLRAAKQYILLQYYIFSDDKLGTEIADILMQKAREGLKVAVIYDHVGSFSARSQFFKRMRDAGVDAHPFFRVTFPQLANRINWRNHRKIVVVDGIIGYIGGMNIADRYISGLSKKIEWRDTHFRLEGDIVKSLILSFVVDWSFPNPGTEYKYRHQAQQLPDNHVGIQLVTSGPNDAWHNISLCFLKAIASARKRIYIQTPYFLPTDALMHALETAALSNVDVRIMIPRRNDSRMLQLGSFSFVTQCIKAGIKVYLYNPGMQHSKVLIIDDDVVSAGSTNFDFRSFENNFESNIFVYDRDFNKRMRDIFFSDLEKCTKITTGMWQKRSRWQRTLESIVRLMSPIL